MSAPLFKAGTYIAGEGRMFMKLVGVIQGELNLYAGYNPDDDGHLHWYTEDDLLSYGYVEAEPKWEEWSTIRVGDMIQPNESVGYIKVLAMVGAAVLLSEMNDPEARTAMQIIKDKNLPVPQGVQEMLKRAGSARSAQSKPGVWLSVRQIALMNWKLIREEHDA